jgi:hypothetical protein
LGFPDLGLQSTRRIHFGGCQLQLRFEASDQAALHRVQQVIRFSDRVLFLPELYLVFGNRSLNGRELTQQKLAVVGLSRARIPHIYRRPETTSGWSLCLFDPRTEENCVQDVRQLATCLFFIIEWHTSEPRGDSVQRFY